MAQYPKHFSHGFSPHMILFPHTDFKDLKDCYAIRYAVIQRKKRNNTVLCHSGRGRPQGPHPAKHPRWFNAQGRALCPSATNVDENGMRNRRSRHLLNLLNPCGNKECVCHAGRGRAQDPPLQGIHGGFKAQKNARAHVFPWKSW